jgi:quercetin 2,3-dioxygenase
VTEILAAREVPLGGLRAMTVRRTLPQRQRSLIGAWCFLDHYGPDRVDETGGMQVPPHPHIGLQTVSWLFGGTVEHRDSLGTHALVKPGELNLMTAGRGISHSEISTDDTTVLHGVQLWLALPGSQRQVAPAFEHHPELPAAGLAGFKITVFAGSLAGVRSPATVFSPVVGAQLRAGRDTRGQLGLEPGYEHVIFMAAGTAEADGAALIPGTLLYLPTGRDQVTLAAAADAELFLLGGEPLDQPVVMWWNFVGTTPQDIIDAVRDWGHGERFGQVTGYHGPPLAAPPLDAVRLRGSGVRPR